MKTLKQILRVIRLVGLPKAARMKKHHEQGLGPIRGHVATRCFWSLLQCGLWDEVQKTGWVDITHFAREHDIQVSALHAVCKYLDGIGWVRLDSGILRIERTVQTLLEEPRGLYELGYAYEPIMNNLDDLLSGKKEFGKDVQRRTDWVGIGSGRLSQQLPYLVLGDLVARYGGNRVLDLGCGDGAFVIWMLQRIGGLQAVGLDLDAPTVNLARRQVTAIGLADRAKLVCGDMFDLVKADGLTKAMPELEKIDTITVCDTFHEYLWEGQQPVVEFLRAIKRKYPEITIVMGDFCVQDDAWLRKHPIASLEHHLWHDLTRQRLISEKQWRDIFQQAGFHVAEANVFDIIGHGYFVLK